MSLMMANNPSSSSTTSSMMKHHHQEVVAAAGAVPIQQHMSYHHHHRHHHGGGGGGGDDPGGGGGGSASPSSVVQSAAGGGGGAAVVCSYNNSNSGSNNSNNGKLSSGVCGGVLESSYNTSTTATRFQPNLHGISMDWTPEEQAILDEGLKTYATESNVARYAKIAVLLKNKTVRDVALRYKWMIKRDISRRRKDDLSLRKNKERKEKLTDPSARSSQAMKQPGFLPYAQGVVTNKNGFGISYNAIDGVTGELLRQNARAFDQISANLATYQIHNNIGLFCQARDNLSEILKRINEPPYIMKHMPALPVKVNEELASTILHQSNLPMQ